MDLYIYYRVDPAHAVALNERVSHVQHQLRAQYGVAAELKRRPEEKAGYQTWMEVYLNTPTGFEDALKQAIDAAGISHLIADTRHTEYFVGVSTCA